MRPKCIVILGSAAIFGTLLACQKRGPVAVVAAPVSAPSSPLAHADSAFRAGDYDEAARGYESHVRTTAPGAAQRDEALFRWALTYALRPAPGTDWQRATAVLKQLLDESPDSPLKGPASLILQLRADLDLVTSDVKARDQRIRLLTTELDRLKKIDADRLKRP